MGRLLSVWVGGTARCDCDCECVSVCELVIVITMNRRPIHAAPDTRAHCVGA